MLNIVNFAKKRDKTKSEFDNAQFAIGLISTKTGSTGLTFPTCRYLFVLDPPWDHSWFIQTIFRIYRVGQTRDCFAFLLVTTSEKKERSLQEAVLKCCILKDFCNRYICAKGNMAEIYFEDQPKLENPRIEEALEQFKSSVSDRKVYWYSYCSKMKEEVQKFQNCRQRTNEV